MVPFVQARMAIFLVLGASNWTDLMRLVALLLPPNIDQSEVSIKHETILSS